MIHVVVTIEVKPGKREPFLAEFRRNLTNVLAEKGCIEYGPAVDLNTEIKAQIPLRENVVTVLEKGEGLPALQSHLAAPHMAAYRERVKDFVVGATFQILEPK